MLNLTQHNATMEQVQDGVIEPDAETKARIQSLLTFETLPNKSEIIHRARALAEIVTKCRVQKALIGGAPYLMSALENELTRVGIEPAYSFSSRISEEIPQSDGTLKKINIFKHVGFITL